MSVLFFSRGRKKICHDRSPPPPPNKRKAVYSHLLFQTTGRALKHHPPRTQNTSVGGDRLFFAVLHSWGTKNICFITASCIGVVPGGGTSSDGLDRWGFMPARDSFTVRFVLFVRRLLFLEIAAESHSFPAKVQSSARDGLQGTGLRHPGHLGTRKNAIGVVYAKASVRRTHSARLRGPR